MKGKNNPMFDIHRFGINAPNYKDGRSLIKYPSLFINIRKVIRERDNFECQNCEMTEEEHIISLGIVLTIHHIDYNKENNGIFNLITLCKTCNSRANANRDYWKRFYFQLLIKKLDEFQILLKWKNVRLISYKIKRIS